MKSKKNYYIFALASLLIGLGLSQFVYRHDNKNKSRYTSLLVQQIEQVKIHLNYQLQGHNSLVNIPEQELKKKLSTMLTKSEVLNWKVVDQSGDHLYSKNIDNEKIIIPKLLSDKTSFLSSPYKCQLESASKCIDYFLKINSNSKAEIYLIVTLNFDSFLGNFLSTLRFGTSGETYIVALDGTRLSKSRFENESIETNYDSKINNIAQQTIQAKKSAFNISGYLDYRGIPVIGAWEVDPRHDFAILTEIDVEEAYSEHIANTMLITIFYFSINIIGIIIINLLYKSKKKDFDINSQIKQSFTSLINLFDGWVFILDENYRIIEVGGKIEKIMRFELAQDFRRLMIELKCFPHLLQQDFEKDIFSQEIELMVNDNHNKYRISKSSFYSPKKRSVVTIADITSQKKIKNEAILNAERISLVLENSGLAFLDWDLKTNKVVHGEEFFKMLGQYSIEWKNDFSIWEAFVDPNQKAKLFEELNKCQIGRINHLLTQVKIKHRDGHWVNIHIQAKIVAHDALKRPERIMGSYLNLSNFQSDEKGGA